MRHQCVIKKTKVLLYNNIIQTKKFSKFQNFEVFDANCASLKFSVYPKLFISMHIPEFVDLKLHTVSYSKRIHTICCGFIRWSHIFLSLKSLSLSLSMEMSNSLVFSSTINVGVIEFLPYLTFQRRCFVVSLVSDSFLMLKGKNKIYVDNFSNLATTSLFLLLIFFNSFGIVAEAL